MCVTGLDEGLLQSCMPVFCSSLLPSSFATLSEVIRLARELSFTSLSSPLGCGDWSGDGLDGRGRLHREQGARL